MMRRHASSRPPRQHTAVLLTGLLLCACKGTSYDMRFDAARFDVPGSDVAPDAAPGEDGKPPTCTAAEGEALMASSCGYCHCSGCSLDLASPALVDRLLGVAPDWADPMPRGCRGQGVLLQPVLPPAGVLWDKLTMANPPCGSSMTYLPDSKVGCVQEWLTQQLTSRLTGSADASTPVTDAAAGADGS